MKRSFLTLLCAGALAAWAGPVSYHGMLTVNDGHIKNSDGTRNVQVKGPSLYWSTNAGHPQYNQKTVDWFVENMDISVIRAAMAIRYWDNLSKDTIWDGDRNFGYLSSEYPTAKEEQLARIEAVIQAAILNDIYVIVDWHSHNAHNETAEAAAFFADIATRYKGVPNLIFEIYNEPTSAVSWSKVETYARTVIPAIRKTGNDNLILVGSPSWSATPDAGAGSTLHKDYKNIAYSLHFYAGTHLANSSHRTSANKAMQGKAAVFVSEWGTTLATGDGEPNSSSSQNWMDWMDSAGVSSCNWSAVNLNETSAMWATGVANTVENLSSSGKIFNRYMQKRITAPDGYPSGKSLTVNMEEGATRTFTLADLGASSGATLKGIENLPDSLGKTTVSTAQFAYTAPVLSPSASASFNYVLENAGKTSRHRITVNIDRAPRVAKTRLAVSSAKPSTLSMASFGITDPDNDAITVTLAQVDAGTIAKSADGKSLTFAPSQDMASKDSSLVALSLTLSSGGLTREYDLTLVAKNVAPELSNKVATLQNTEEASWAVKDMVSYDADGDSLLFSTAKVGPGYPGSVSLSKDGLTLTYVPEAGKISGERVPVYFTLTDGVNQSNEARLMLTIKGVGVAIAADLTPVVQVESSAQFGLSYAQGRLQVRLDGASPARLEVYSLQGSQLGHFALQSSGEVDLSPVLKTGGVYWLRLAQGSRQQVLRLARP